MIGRFYYKKFFLSPREKLKNVEFRATKIKEATFEDLEHENRLFTELAKVR
jgi:hypothetical protein